MTARRRLGVYPGAAFVQARSLPAAWLAVNPDVDPLAVGSR